MNEYFVVVGTHDDGTPVEYENYDYGNCAEVALFTNEMGGNCHVERRYEPGADDPCPCGATVFGEPASVVACGCTVV